MATDICKRQILKGPEAGAQNFTPWRAYILSVPLDPEISSLAACALAMLAGVTDGTADASHGLPKIARG